MKIMYSVTAALLLIASPALASKEKLEGYGNIKFGMSAGQALKILGSSKTITENTKYGISEFIEGRKLIQNMDFDIKYTIKEGKISDIYMRHKAKSCSYATESVLKGMNSSYGKPDLVDTNSELMKEYTFFFKDGAEIKMTTIADFDTGCNVHVRYKPRNEGGSF